MPPDLLIEVRAVLSAHADPERAVGQQRYMKSAMPFHGVTRPVVRRICRPILNRQTLDDVDAWRDAILTLWHGATHREERYVAVDLLHHRRFVAFRRDRPALPLYDELIVDGAWWDVVDEVSTGALGQLLEAERAWLTPIMRTRARDADRWKRRASIICQLNHKQATDLALLYDCIEANLDDRDFFIRKAVGWALRQYARIDPDEVGRYVEAHAGRLSPLSKREALKNVLRMGRITAIP
jgi:3-methyladenine DNA glycosylase AlkD